MMTRLRIAVGLVLLPIVAIAQEGKLDSRLAASLAGARGDVPVIVTTQGAPAGVVQRAQLLGAQVTWVYDIIDGFAATLPSVALTALAADPDVAKIFADREVVPILDNSHKAIRANRAWSSGYTGNGVTVAVLDSGIDRLHSFFSGAIVSCVSTIAGIVSPECADSEGHGSHVAGIIASRDAEYPGIAKAARLAVIRVLHAGGTGLSSDIIAGMQWVANNKNRVTPRIRVANMSIGYMNPGCGNDSDPMAIAANNLVASGVVFTVAAGNSGHTKCTIDGASAASKVITVAAVDDRNTVTQSDDVIAGFSSGGGGTFNLRKPDVSFPGVKIWSAYLTPFIAELSGTSMAAPHAAGVAALVVQKYPSSLPDDVKSAILGSALKTSNTGSSWNSRYGHGLGNACRALGLSGC